jgi:hypothetical protein
MSTLDLRDAILREDVRQDKMEIHIGEWIVEAPDDRIIDFVHHLTRLDRTGCKYRCRIFRRNGQCPPIRTSKNIPIVQHDGASSLHPLFSGQLNIRKIGACTYSIKLQLFINPTRFCAYQNIGLRNRLGEGRFGTLYTRRIQTDHNGEYTFDGKDNVALTDASQLHLSSNYQHCLQLYINGIIDYINEELEECAVRGFTLRDFKEYYSLRIIENYWEFSCENPVAEVKRLETAFRAITNENLINFYRDERIETDGLSIALRCESLTGERIKIYAKTNRRIRIEVEHKLKNNAGLTPHRRYTCFSYDRLIYLIQHSEQLATESASEVINALYSYANAPRILRSRPIDFVTMLYRVVNDIELAKEILQTLVAAGGISRTNAQKYPKKIINDLKREGLIVYQGMPQARYIVDRRFSDVTQRLL